MTYLTGIGGFDSIIGVLPPGTSVLFRNDHEDQYAVFARALSEEFISRGYSVLYFHFGYVSPGFINGEKITTICLNTDSTFEDLISEIHRKIRKFPPPCCLIFDSMTGLSDHCYSDRMIGNFFILTSRLIKEVGHIAYFSIRLNFHSYHAMDAIEQSVDSMFDLYTLNSDLYIQTRKISSQHEPPDSRLHRLADSGIIPVRSSSKVAEILSSSPWPGLPSASYRMVGAWEKIFIKADNLNRTPDYSSSIQRDKKDIFRRILRLVISTDPEMLSLAEKYFTLGDIITIWKRMIGTGMIGGKSVGMLLARKILEIDNPEWRNRLEVHDSFYIGSDVFYTFLVMNDCWQLRQKQKDPETYLDDSDTVRKKILQGEFPEYILTRFRDMLDYFGQSPIIVRSSSFLEDAFGNAFAGKYESVFCCNQGLLDERLRMLLDAIRQIYASAGNPEALQYRKERGILERDEQMALLVQRVSGAPHGDYFFPQTAGVALSFNPYVWSREIDPEAGMVRFVFGLGTRAVDRSDDDYTRIISLNAPERRPESSVEERGKYVQRKVDLLNLQEQEFENRNFLDVLKEDDNMPLDLFISRDSVTERRHRQNTGTTKRFYLLDFQRLIRETSFVPKMRDMLAALKRAYGMNVDVEFTANFGSDGSMKINLVQCRPLQIQGIDKHAEAAPRVKEEDILIKSDGGVIGHSRVISIDTMLYVDPEKYSSLNENNRYLLADYVGKLCHLPKICAGTIMLIGPGRWGTSTPSLGVPVSFSDIRPVSVLMEIDTMHEGLIPDLSLGTHFFNEMVECNLLYLANFTESPGNIFNRELFSTNDLSFSEKMQVNPAVAAAVKVITPGSLWNRRVLLNADAMNQTMILYRS